MATSSLTSSTATSSRLLLFLLLPFATMTTTASPFRVNIIRLPSQFSPAALSFPPSHSPTSLPPFREAPAFRNADDCSPSHHVHIAMTLDANYLRGTMAAILSILQHSSCPESVAFHFLASRLDRSILSSIKSTFPYLDFNLYHFDSARVRGRISHSIRYALDQPLNYARIYLAEILPKNVSRVIYLDSDVIVVDDLQKLWDVVLEEKHAVAAPEYCHTNFTKYFTDLFWFDPELATTFEGRKPCYFNTGVMMLDVNKWRRSGYTKLMEDWMEMQKRKRIYNLGSLPPFLLVLAGNIKPVEHRWNQHGLGGDNLEGKCRRLHPGPISLLHWSGKGKPWLRLDSRKPCAVDHLWAPYDLYRPSSPTLEE